MPAPVILIIDDDDDYRAITAGHLRSQRYGVLEATKCEVALGLLRRHDINLILLEINLRTDVPVDTANHASRLPIPSGHDLLEVMRALPDYIPVIVLTELDQATDEIVSIQGGANVFLRKPVNTSLLMAYVRSQLRTGPMINAGRHARLTNQPQPSTPPEQASIVYVRDLLIDTQQRLVRRGDGPYCHLSKGEIGILAVLARSPDKVFSKQQIIRMAFGDDAGVTEQGVGAVVKRLRAKLEPGAGKSEYIVSDRGLGYRFLAALP